MSAPAASPAGDQAVPRPSSANSRRSTTAAFVGTAIEWYDFYIFGTAAALVFGTVFYPELAPGAGLIASFATFWVGFLARPIGGLIFSHFGDRFGRKNTLIATLLLMGVGSMCIGLLPGFHTIGIAAPILLILLRAVQGIAVGGEWGGAVVLATESADEKRRGMAGTWVQQGSPAGAVLATLAFMLVGLLPDDAFMSWGWRLPFLASAVLVIVAMFIRLGVEESQDFQQIAERNETPAVPVAEAFRTSPGVIVAGVLASIIGIAFAYFTNTFLLAWTTGPLGMNRTVILNILLIIAIVQFIWQPLAALIAERIGAMRVMIGGLIITAAIAPALFYAIQSGSALLLGIVLCVNVFGATGYYALLANALSEAFPARIRYTGVSVSYQLCATIFGGSTPVLAQWLLNSTGGNAWLVMCLYLTLIALTIIGTLSLLRGTARREADLNRTRQKG
ncbi:MFS transporter [Brevibacterium luteolum]|uniref:Putative proline/betaine transporter n=1 Tax=Brevibacterium luteolum TaxID=199591 RepID=A0A6G8KYJ1_9MICO|nr:MFS transporter [Brevibacterium luteolum]QIN29877.1 MFS transporter [Brevibacterium luteolum]